MGKVEMVMPQMGEGVIEATVLTWLKKEGESIDLDESVLEVATDKVDTEVPATHAGVLQKILAKEGEVVPVGSPLAFIEVEATNNDIEEETDPVGSLSAGLESVREHVSNGIQEMMAANQEGRFYSPLVRSIAKEENISVAELGSISGSGQDGRVTKDDILQYVEAKKQSPTNVITQSNGNGEVKAATPTTFVATPPITSNGTNAPSFTSNNGQDEIIEMGRMRKMIAQRMVESKQTSAHVASFIEVDVTPIVKWRNQYKTSFKQKHGSSFTFTPIFIEAVVKAIREFPMINISVGKDQIIKKKDINIGMAVALPNGNLIVPVIKNADHYNLSGLALKVNDLATRARENQLKPEEVQGGTYTITNIGTFGNILGTPIIMQPQVAIMAFGAITKKPAVIETPEGDLIGIRHKMYLSHSYDHRVVDGSLGGMFVKKVADNLEAFDIGQAV